MHFVIGVVVHVAGWVINHLFPHTDPALGHAVSAVGGAYAGYHVGELVEAAKRMRSPVEHPGVQGFNPFDPKSYVHEAEKALKSLEGGLESALRNLEGTLETSLKTLAQQLEAGMKALGTRLEREIRYAGDTAEKAVENAGMRALSDVKKIAKDAENGVKAALGKLEEIGLKALAQRALSAAAKVVKTAAPSDVSIQVGPVQIDVGDPMSKVEAIEHWAAHPPGNKDDVIALIDELAPVAVTLSIDAQLALVLVTTSDLEIGFAATWTKDHFLREGSQLLDDFHWS